MNRVNIGQYDNNHIQSFVKDMATANDHGNEHMTLRTGTIRRALMRSMLR